MVKVEKLLNNTLPLCFMPDGRLLCYRRGSVLVLRDNRIEKTISVRISTKERLLGWSRLMTRLFRFGVRSSIALDNETAILNIGNSLFELNVESGKFSTGWYCGEGIRPLVLTNVNDLDGFEDGIYFGGYLKNNDKHPVHIYHRVEEDKWKAVYTFPEGAINHIHNLVVDPFRKCIWCFTGDFGDAAAIWKMEDGFQDVKCIASSDQQYRGCVVFAIPEGLLYATDTPFAKNSIYLLKEDTSLQSICSISGSCIYGCQWKDKYVFSTVVEPDGRNETLLRLLFGRKRGAGIIDNFARIYAGSINGGFIEIDKEKKDLLPFIFQFGAFKFPYGQNNDDALYFQPVSTKSNDLDLIKMS